MLEISKIKFNGINITNSPNKGLSTFKGNVIYSDKPEEFVKQDKKKKLSTGQKIGIGAGVLAFCGIVASAILTKGKTLQPANFKEYIEFTKANTMEEAIEFAKKNFGIRTFDFGDDLEFANWVNEGLVNINNRFKGKANIVKNLRFATPEEIAKQPKAYALCNSLNYHSDDASILFNKNLIDKAKDKFQSSLHNIIHLEKLENNEITYDYFLGGDKQLLDKILKLGRKMLEQPEEFSRFDALNGITLFQDYMHSYVTFSKNKLSILKNKIFTNDASVTILKNNGISVNIDDYSRLDEKELTKKTKEILNILDESNINLNFGTAPHRIADNKFEIIYHEMGHHLHGMNTSMFDTSFWGRLSKKAKKLFRNDSGKQKIALAVSPYAATNPREFVAECFCALCCGRKLPEDVMKMYEYYKGPIIPNM